MAGLFKTIFKITILKAFLIIFKIGKSRVVENIFPEKISHDLWKSNNSEKLVWSDSKEKFYFQEVVV